MERGGLTFIKTWGRTSLDEWHEWAKNTQSDNEGDVLIQALLQVPLDFTQHLCSRVFGFMAPHEHYHGPSRLNRAALEILGACAWGEGGHLFPSTLITTTSITPQACRAALHVQIKKASPH